MLGVFPSCNDKQSNIFSPSIPNRQRSLMLTAFTMSPTSPDRYKLIFFTPPQHLPEIKKAIFAAGAGRYPGQGGYTEVCFTTAGASQFRPGSTASPHLGEPGKLEQVDEVRCETLCVGRDVVTEAVEALKG